MKAAISGICAGSLFVFLGVVLAVGLALGLSTALPMVAKGDTDVSVRSQVTGAVYEQALHTMLTSMAALVEAHEGKIAELAARVEKLESKPSGIAPCVGRLH